MSIELGVNIDHVATLRQQRGTRYPDPIRAARLAEQCGADLITLHLREDRRHIQDSDVEQLRGCLTTRMNLEAAVTDEMVEFALRIRPEDVCLVPERRQELTTEGGLDVIQGVVRIREACRRLAAGGIRVSLFIDPDPAQIDAARACEVPAVELHTGRYAEAVSVAQSAEELARIAAAARHGHRLGLKVNAGHGLHYENVKPVAAIREIAELNIGHAIVAEAVFSGWEPAVRRMKQLMIEGRGA